MSTQIEKQNAGHRLLPVSLEAAFRTASVANSQALTIRLWGGLCLLGLLALALSAHPQRDDQAKQLSRRTAQQAPAGSARVFSHSIADQKLRPALSVHPPHAADQE